MLIKQKYRVDYLMEKKKGKCHAEPQSENEPKRQSKCQNVGGKGKTPAESHCLGPKTDSYYV